MYKTMRVSNAMCTKLPTILAQIYHDYTLYLKFVYQILGTFLWKPMVNCRIHHLIIMQQLTNKPYEEGKCTFEKHMRTTSNEWFIYLRIIDKSNDIRFPPMLISSLLVIWIPLSSWPIIYKISMCINSFYQNYDTTNGSDTDLSMRLRKLEKNQQSYRT